MYNKSTNFQQCYTAVTIFKLFMIYTKYSPDVLFAEK